MYGSIRRKEQRRGSGQITRRLQRRVEVIFLKKFSLLDQDNLLFFTRQERAPARSMGLPARAMQSGHLKNARAKAHSIQIAFLAQYASLLRPVELDDGIKKPRHPLGGIDTCLILYNNK